jgi:hypothetical protein
MTKFKASITMIILILSITFAYAQESYKLEYKFEKGKTYLYKDFTTGDITQEMMGREIKMKNESNAVIRIVVDNVAKDREATLLVSADSLSVFSSTPRGDTTMTMNEMIGKRTKVILSSTGKITKIETIDSIKLMGRAMGGAQREGIKFAQLSDKPVKIGETWTSSTQDTVNQMGGKIVVTGNHEYTLVGKEKKDGYDCLKITFTGKTTTEGKASVQGMEFFIDGSGKVNGTFFFNPKAGLLIYEETNTDSETNMATTGEQSMIIPITQVTKSIRNLLK